MPLQNRVHPNGDIISTPERGTMLGNRGGKFHRADKTLGQRRWSSHHWIVCELHYRNMQHEPMGQGYTSLFFLDEVTALAAGHRPCFFCRRAEAKRFVELSGMTTGEFDRVLHRERVVNGGKENISSLLWREGARHKVMGREFPALPDGVMVETESEPFAIRGPHLLRWSFAGYTAAISRNSIAYANLLTPPTIMRILAKGYQPRWHPSAEQWELT